MITIPTLSFCITCKNRIYQIVQTLKKNLEDNRLHNDWIEFILVDFGSTDGLHDWVMNNFMEDIKTGYLKYFYTDELIDWKCSLAKNTAHWCSQNDIVVNLDCDNFTGFFGGRYVIKQFLLNRDVVLHQFSGRYNDGTCGRIAVLKKYFEFVGGYDESFEPHGYQDIDLIHRLVKSGLKYLQITNKKYSSAIINSKDEGIHYAKSRLTYSEMNESNRKKSLLNISDGNFIVNQGIFGIRKKIYNHDGQLINT